MTTWTTGAPDGRALLADGVWEALFDDADVATLAAGALTAAAPRPPAPAAVKLTATPGDAAVTLTWDRDATDKTLGWLLTRDGTDSRGTGPWSTPLPATARRGVMSSLINGQRYAFALTDVATGAIATANAIPVAAPPPPGPTPTPGGDGVQAAVTQGWGKPIGGDEFEGTALDLAKWGPYDGPGHNGNGRRVPSAFTVKDGILTCRGLANGDTGGMWFRGYSARTYRVEARMAVRAIGTSGDQYHPVLIMWPDSDQWPQGGEDDFAETDVGAPGVQAFIHHPRQGSGSAQSTASRTLDITKPHNYAIERSSTAVVGWIDGVEWFRFAGAALDVPGPMHPTIQLDNFTGGRMREAVMEVSFLRIYGAPK